MPGPRDHLIKSAKGWTWRRPEQEMGNRSKANRTCKRRRTRFRLFYDCVSAARLKGFSPNIKRRECARGRVAAGIRGSRSLVLLLWRGCTEGRERRHEIAAQLLFGFGRRIRPRLRRCALHRDALHHAALRIVVVQCRMLHRAVVREHQHVGLPAVAVLVFVQLSVLRKSMLRSMRLSRPFP